MSALGDGNQNSSLSTLNLTYPTSETKNTFLFVQPNQFYSKAYDVRLVLLHNTFSVNKHKAEKKLRGDPNEKHNESGVDFRVEKCRALCDDVSVCTDGEGEWHTLANVLQVNWHAFQRPNNSCA